VAPLNLRVNHLSPLIVKFVPLSCLNCDSRVSTQPTRIAFSSCRDMCKRKLEPPRSMAFDSIYFSSLIYSLKALSAFLKGQEEGE
jgi:hypothetical protein